MLLALAGAPGALKTLELFAGTQSITKGLKRDNPNHTMVTVDLLSKFDPTHVCDIMRMNYKAMWPPYSFDFIWASPVCTYFSKAHTREESNYIDLLLGSIEMVEKTIEMIQYLLKPDGVYIIENVGTGLLVDLMPGLWMHRDPADPPPIFVDYCSYGAKYRKRTVLWSNVELDLKQCQVARCASTVFNQKTRRWKHTSSCGNGRYTDLPSLWQKNAIPAPLVDEIIRQVTIKLR